MRFNKDTGVLSLTPNAAPREALESLEEAIQISMYGTIKLTLPPNNREFTFNNVTGLEYLRAGLGPSDSSNYVSPKR